jgi:hypothetical protein
MTEGTFRIMQKMKILLNKDLLYLRVQEKVLELERMGLTEDKAWVIDWTLAIAETPKD